MPALLGLDLADAEYRARASQMTLHVERVPGQPVGRVLEQAPPPGAGRPAGGVLKVVVTAGGDREGVTPPAPLVGVGEIAVPDLLDRTEPQVRRILDAVGLVATVEQTPHGLPGRVGDQRPPAGTVVPKGGAVLVRVGPPAVPAAPPASLAPVAPAGSGAPAAAPPRPEAEVSPTAPAAGPTPHGPELPPEWRSGPVEAPPAPGGAGSAGVAAPVIVSPAPGTVVGPDRSLTLGFTWRPVPGADAYLIEVEELGPDGWVPNARSPVRAAAAVLVIERLMPSAGPLRWRVLALARGRKGPPSEWVVLR